MQQKQIWMIQSCRWNKYFDFTSTAVTNYLVDYCCLVCYICSAEEGKRKKPQRVKTQAQFYSSDEEDQQIHYCYFYIHSKDFGFN